MPTAAEPEEIAGFTPEGAGRPFALRPAGEAPREEALRVPHGD